jgi:ketosteroid isomerase-like protein
MSQENVEVVRRFIEAYNRRDFEAIIELMDPTFEFRSRFVGIESVHRASEGFPYTYFQMLDDAYDHFEVVLSEFIDAGAAVLAAGYAEWRGKASGARGETPVLPAFWLRTRKVLRAETFTDRKEALEAVGLDGGHGEKPSSSAAGSARTGPTS